MDQDLRSFSNEMLIKILDKRVELASSNEAEIVDFIREVMARRLYLELGADSMFDFLTGAHYHFAPNVAQRKLDSARVMQLFPHVKDLIASGELNLTQLGMLATALRQKPASPDLQEEVLERTKEVVSHSVPSGELGEVITYCANLTLAKKDPTFTTDKEVKPRQCQGVSRASRSSVLRRDKSCRHLHSDGRVCGSRYQLQVDHIKSRWAGGGNEVENLQALCGVHNRYKYRREMRERFSAPS